MSQSGFSRTNILVDDGPTDNIRKKVDRFEIPFL